jgi:hypothetical protein
MSHLDARLSRGYSAVGATLEQLPAMLALDTTARALCVELARATGGKPLQRRMVRLIGPALGQDEATVDAPPLDICRHVYSRAALSMRQSGPLNGRSKKRSKSGSLSLCA